MSRPQSTLRRINDTVTSDPRRRRPIGATTGAPTRAPTAATLKPVPLRRAYAQVSPARSTHSPTKLATTKHGVVSESSGVGGVKRGMEEDRGATGLARRTVDGGLASAVRGVRDVRVVCRTPTRARVPTGALPVPRHIQTTPRRVLRWSWLPSPQSPANDPDSRASSGARQLGQRRPSDVNSKHHRTITRVVK